MKLPAVYLYKKTSDKGRELRYSLRSLENIKNWNGEVFVVGDREPWMNNLTVIAADKYPHRFSDVRAKYLAITRSPLIPNDFILMNDDFFVTERAEVKPLHQGELSGGTSSWQQCKERTKVYLQSQGIAKPLDYDIHVPMIMNKDKLAEALKANEGATEHTYLANRSIYGNLHKIGGKEYVDGKTKSNAILNREFISTSLYNDKLNDLFPTCSRFEIKGETMQNVTPTKHEDGKETVTLWGKTVDVTKVKKFTLFKREFKVVRPKKAKKADAEKTDSDE